MAPDEVGDPHNLDIRCLVNGEERQHSNTKNLIFSCFDAVAHLSQAFTLDVGDVLFMRSETLEPSSIVLRLGTNAPQQSCHHKIEIVVRPVMRPTLMLRRSLTTVLVVYLGSV